MSDKEPPLPSEPSLLVCPKGHTTWTTTDDRYQCLACDQMEGVDATFDELHDPKTGEPVTAFRRGDR
jgi:hypothetical protein